MCVGFTHSGKTTFSRELESKLTDAVLIDSDAIAEFAKNNYENLFTSEYNRSKRSLDDPNLKFGLYQHIFEFALRADTPTIILSNGNLANDMRNYIQNEAQKYDYKVITVYFNLPTDVIAQRVASSIKDISVFTLKKTWSDIVAQQKRYAELPPSKDTDYYFEIIDDNSRKVVFDEILDILK